MTSSAVKTVSTPSIYNPLDEFEDLLESSAYDYDRAGKTRLHFNAQGRQGSYGVMLEWNGDARIVKCSLVIAATQSIPRDILESCVLQANEASWNGFFVLDGVGNSIFKSLITLSGQIGGKAMELIEDTIDTALQEADRFCVSLALTRDKDVPGLFGHDDNWTLENMVLMFSEVKGNA